MGHSKEICARVEAGSIDLDVTDHNLLRGSVVHVPDDALLFYAPKETRLCMVLCIVQFLRH